MTDTNTSTEQSSTGQSTEATTTNTDGAGAGAGAGGEAKSWLDHLPEAMRADKNLAKYESLEAFANGHLNALKRFGKDPASLIEVPAKPDDEKAWGDLWGKLGRPETAEGYQLQLGEDATDADKAFVDGFRAVAHKAGLTQSQMGAAIQYLNDVTAKAGEAARQQAETAAAETTKALAAEWGDKKAVYDQAIPKLVEKLGGEKAIEALNADGLGNSATMLKILAKMTDLMAEQEKLPGGGGGGGDGANTPYQAQAKLAELHGDKDKMAALNDRSHPRHKVVMAEREALLKQAYPAGT